MAAGFGSSSEITTRSGFLQENAQINHYPRDQREWTQFIRELARWRNEYEGIMDLTSNGFDADPVSFSDIPYYRYGKFVVINFQAQESTSDAALFTLSTIPARIRPAVPQTVPIINLVDNGTPTTGQCTIQAEGQLNFGLDGNSGGFTASGAKGFGDLGQTTVIYSLFDAERID